MGMRRQLHIITLCLVAGLFILQMVIQTIFMNAMRTVYMSNVDSTITRSVSELRALLSQQESAVRHIAGEPDVTAYAATEDSEARYELAFSSILPITRSAVQNLRIDCLAIYDISNAWYQFSGALRFKDYQWVRQHYESITDLTTEPLVLDNALYFCTAYPLFSLEYQSLKRNGLIIALIGDTTVRGILPDPDDEMQVSVLLHDDQRILLSNNTEWEGILLGQGPVGDGRFYTRTEPLFPDLWVTVSIPHNQIFPQELPFILIFLSMLLFTAIVLLVIISLSNRWFLRPITQVMNQMQTLPPEGERLYPTGVAHIDTLVDGVNGLIDRLEAANRQTIATQQSLYETELEKQKTQLFLLKKQINAHFLYNCLTGIKTLTEQGEPDLAGEMAEGVALLMRYTHSTQEEVNIFDEMSIIQRYVRIMNIRFHGRFSYTFDVDDSIVSYKMLRLLLQPLVENALVHGLEKSSSTCELHVTGTVEGGDLLFTVRDNGIGIPPEKLVRIQSNLDAVTENYEYWSLKGISLINIQKRVKTAYGGPYGLIVESRENAYTKITLRLPALADNAQP